MRFDDDMDRRLQNWARWMIEREEGPRIGGGTPRERVDGEGWDAPSVIPTNDAEAQETFTGLRAVGADHQRACWVWYVSGGTVTMRCRRAGCSETELRSRVAMAHRRLGQWLTDKRQAADAERHRVQQLQRMA